MIHRDRRGRSSRYEEKRDFATTPEPSPGSHRKRSARESSTFVVQEHAARRLHYDFRLELDGVLKSWALPKGPPPDPETKRLAVMVEDHPLEYSSFQGTIPKGEYGAGQVSIWDEGTYSAEEGGMALFDDPGRSDKVMRDGIASGKVSFVLRGRRLTGSWTLVRTRRGQNNWLLIKHRDGHNTSDRDEPAKETSVPPDRRSKALQPDPTIPRPESTVRNAPGSRRAPPPSFIAPMLATPATAPAAGPGWLWEPKLDGFRTIALMKKGEAKLFSRRGLDVTSQYPDVAEMLSRQPASELALDGEITALDEKGRPCFQCLQRLSKGAPSPAGGQRAAPIIYYVFDILHLDGFGLFEVPLHHRKNLLEANLQPSDQVRLVEHFTGDPGQILKAAISTGFEGIVGKQLESVYEPGVRSASWLKVKTIQTDEFIIGGYSAGSGSRSRTFGALLLGQYDEEDRLVYVGHVGSGFDEEILTDLRRRLDAARTDQRPFYNVPRLSASTIWVRPELVAEVKFDQRTENGYLRVPVFLRLREDKPLKEVRHVHSVSPPDQVPTNPKDVLIESVLDQLGNPNDSFVIDVGGYKLGLSNLSKVLWPSAERPITKRDLLAYLARVSPHLLRHTHDRPLTLSRYPDGIGSEHFYQKHWADPLPEFVQTVQLTSHREGFQQYLLCQNLPTLLWLGQMANIEFHVWFSRISPTADAVDRPDSQGSAEGADSYVDHPDFIVFDLDPYIYSGNEPAGSEPELNRQAYARTCEVALWIKELMDGISFTSYVKTSGRTGLHVFVPIQRNLDFEAVRSVASTAARFLLHKHQREITIDWAVRKRSGKVFVDYNQNVRGKTLACAYSPRPASRGTVSMPLRWDEIDKTYPMDFTVFTAPSRLEQLGDLWQSILTTGSNMRDLVNRLS